MDVDRYGAAVPDRALADALIAVVRERMAAKGLSVNRTAALIGVTQQTLDRQLKGSGDIALDVWEALAETVGERLEDLLAEARRSA